MKLVKFPLRWKNKQTKNKTLLSCLISLEIAAVSVARGLVQFPTVILLE